MVLELSYNTISHVIESWEQLRRIENYEEVAGAGLFRRMFEKCPDSKVLFGFPADIDPTSRELLQSKRFLMHGAYLIQMLDTALNMLGPDIELLQEIMDELGTKHMRYGVKPEMFPILGECLVETLQENLKESFTETVRQSWVDTYASLSHDMIKVAADKKVKA